MKLTEQDFELLLPGAGLTIGKTTVKINPFSLIELKELFTKLQPGIEKAGITLENFPHKLAVISGLIIDKSPEIISKCTGIEQADIDRLPACEQLRIIDKIVEVNQTSYAGMEKNLQALRGVLPAILRGVTAMFSTFSSQKGIVGKK